MLKKLKPRCSLFAFVPACLRFCIGAGCTGKKNFSTATDYSTYSVLNNLSIKEFAHWFSGFCDAESNFFISDLDTRFNFYFNIKLHIDDIKVLQNINKKLGVGKIYIHKNTAVFRVSKYEELQKIFDILEIKPLNTTSKKNVFCPPACCIFKLPCV